VETDNRGFIAVQNYSSGLLYFYATEGDMATYDGTDTYRQFNVDWSKDDNMISVVRWDSTRDSGAGHKLLSTYKNGAWTMNTGQEGAMDGTYFLADHLRLNWENIVPNHIKQITFFDEYLTDEVLLSEFWIGGIATRMSGDSLITDPQLEVLRLMSTAMVGDTIITDPRLVVIYEMITSMSGDSLTTDARLQVIRLMSTIMTGETVITDPQLEVLRLMITSMLGDSLTPDIARLLPVVLGQITSLAISDTSAVLGINEIGD
jgi:hypothetical protein